MLIVSSEVKPLKGIQLYTMLATSVGLPGLLFFYMVFYFLVPQPRVFSKEFSHKIFPNLEKEYEYLVSVGKQDFAENFVNYQINIVMFSACAVAIIFTVYILGFLSKYRPLDIHLPTPRIAWISLAWVFVTSCYMWGIGLLDRTSNPTNKLHISGKDDYVFVWLTFTVYLWVFSYIVMSSINFIFLTLKGLFEKGSD